MLLDIETFLFTLSLHCCKRSFVHLFCYSKQRVLSFIATRTTKVKQILLLASNVSVLILTAPLATLARINQRDTACDESKQRDNAKCVSLN
jgi:hypothetical protein